MRSFAHTAVTARRFALALLCLAAGSAEGAATTSVQFGLYDAELNPDGGWTLMTADDFKTHRSAFIDAYNSNGGLDAIAPFRTKNCCVAVAGGMKLVITGTKFGVVFPAATSGAIRCNPTEGYTKPRYKLYQVDKLDATQEFESKSACQTNHNPGVFMRQMTSVTSTANDGVVTGVVFGMYDLESAPAGGWQLMSSADFEANKDAFVEAYETNNGISLIRSFRSGNCCMAVRGGNKLTISGSTYGYQFPASVSGGIRCNPTGGYAEALYQFYKLPSAGFRAHMKANTFGEKKACSTNHNPAVYMLKQLASAKVEFGLYNAQSAPGDGWVLMSDADLRAYKMDFVSAYNTAGGIKIIGDFKSKNCCIALRNNQKITITGTPYGYQFPASADGSIACNPSDGYAKDANYGFYKVPKLDAGAMLFGGKEACTVDNNPGIYFRGAPASDQTFNVWSDDSKRQQADSEQQRVTLEDQVHCQVTQWSSWSSCTARCGVGTRFRVRSVERTSENGGDKCPPLREDNRCVKQDCAVHCEVGDWKKTGDCDAACGGGLQKYTREITTAPNHSGDKCPATEKTEPCNATPCAVHCAWGEWGGWGECNAECDGGQKRRMRKIRVQAQWGGDQCEGAQEEMEACNMQACPQDCLVSEWSVWSDCSRSCKSNGVAGETSRKRIVTRPSAGGAACPELEQTKECNTTPCKIDCVMEGWTNWGECSATCGGGRRMRSNKILRQAAHGGAACSATSQDEPCNVGIECPRHCKLEPEWQKWGGCSATCGKTATQQRRRQKIVEENSSGDCVCESTEIDGDKFCVETRNCEFNPECPVRCETSSWGGWSDCSDACGVGYQTRTRSITKQAAGGGEFAHCQKLEEKIECNTNACPTDCKVSGWGEWGECMRGDVKATCGVGVRERVRHIEVFAQDGGAECPSDLVDVKACNLAPCPQDCTAAEWTVTTSTDSEGWSACSKECGSGTQERTRQMVPNANCPEVNGKRLHFCHGGKVCPFDKETRACKVQECPINCEVSAWGSYSACDRSCGHGTQLRTRIVTKENRNGGSVCPEGKHADESGLIQTRSCHDKHCPVHCEVGSFDDWSECSKRCGGGYQSRVRKILTDVDHNGHRCPALTQTRDCNVGPCAKDCKVGPWTKWPECSKTCGVGSTTRTRSVIQHSKHGGFVCPELTQTQHCNRQPCPVNCMASGWSGWSQCSTRCGPGTKTRSKSIIIAALHGGTPCNEDELVQEKECELRKCSIDCVVSDWTLWSTCTKSCGHGKSSRNRHVVREAKHGGDSCPHLEEDKPCAGAPCPIDCVVGDWEYANASPCTKSCGGGEQVVPRTVSRNPRYHGAACPALSKTQTCNTHACPRDCQVGSWNPFGECLHYETNAPVTCGGGRMTRTRSSTHNAAEGGKACPPLKEVQDCNRGPCPVDCDVSEWGAWSVCTATCGVGRKWRDRTVTAIPKWNGHVCPDLKEEVDCRIAECPVNCQVSTFGAWSLCDKSCGGGNQKRTRSVIVAKQHEGRQCPETEQERACNQQACPIDCQYTAWGEWTGCSASCGQGQRRRDRNITQAMQFGGVTCGQLHQTENCDEGPCPVHCQVTEWTAWGPCSRTCGTGVRTRTRTVTSHARHNGYTCPTLREDQNCVGSSFNETAREWELRPSCPQHCEVGEWEEWSDCDKTCGFGKQHRQRDIVTKAKNGGLPCPVQWEQRGCAEYKCAVHCEVTNWGDWSTPCTAECGGGHMTRKRTISKIPKWNGHVCPALEETKTCNSQECKQDCILSDWAQWSPCSRSCGTDGVTRRTRGVAVPARFGGKKCDVTFETEKCDAIYDNIPACPLHCEVKTWSNWTDCSAECGMGVQTRTRAPKARSACAANEPFCNGGAECPALKETKQCMKTPCPQNCQPSGWLVNANTDADGWETSCSKECGGGKQKRFQKILKPAMYGGSCDVELVEQRKCNKQPCPVDCTLGDWEPWSTCSVSCKTGTHTRTKTAIAEALHGGKSCAELQNKWKQTKECNAGPCPVNCVMGKWNNWGGCDAKCGIGTRTRTREVVNREQYGGYVCGARTETSECMDVVCPQDCRASEWSGWSTCNDDDGKAVPCGGRMTRSKRVLQPQKGTGKACPSPMKQVTECPKCPPTTTTASPTHPPASVPLAPTDGGKTFDYVVRFETGWHEDSGSQSEVQVRFVGTKGPSTWYVLGRDFPRARKGAKTVTIREDVGLLNGLLLRANGDDSWNPINFVNVETPRGANVQFKSNFFIDRLPHEQAEAYGQYPYDETVGLRAVNTESAGKALVVDRDIKVTWKNHMPTTVQGLRAQDGAVYVQLHGTAGFSRFYSLGRDFPKPGEDSRSITVQEEVGNLRKITLMDGSFKDWHAIGDVEVEYKSLAGKAVKASFGMGRDGTWFGGYAPETFTAEGASSGADTVSNMEEHTAAIAARTKLAFHQDTRGGHSGGNVDTIALSSPALHQKETAHFCENNEMLGWKGACPSPKDYCNMCTCTKDGVLKKTMRKCGHMQFDNESDYEECTNVRCRAHLDEDGKSVIKVTHHHLEHLRRHVCTYNKDEPEVLQPMPEGKDGKPLAGPGCLCMCKKPNKQYSKVRAQHGRHNMKRSAEAVVCDTVHFPNPYDPAKLGNVRVVATPSYQGAPDNRQQDAEMLWVEKTTHDRFTVCVRSPPRYRQADTANKQDVSVQWYAHQGDVCWAEKSSQTCRGVSGATPIEGLPDAEDTCQVIDFGKNFGAAPKVIASVDHNGGGIQQVVSVTIEQVNNKKFKACFHNSAQVPDPLSAKPSLNWIAFPHSNPSDYYAADDLPYSVAGRAQATSWAEYPNTAGLIKPAARTWVTCQEVSFRKEFDNTPIVLVNANHESVSALDWSGAEHPTSMTWVNGVGKDSFQVCTTERTTAARNDDNTLKWDWIAFAEPKAYQDSPNGSVADIAAAADV